MSEQHDAGALILNSAHWTHGVDHGEQEVVSRCLPQLCDTPKSHPRRRKRKTSTPSHSFCSLWIREQTLVLCASNRERCRWERHDLQRIQETTKVTEDESEAFRPTHGVHRDVGVFSCPHTLQPSHVWNDTWRSATHSVSACVRVVLSRGGRGEEESIHNYRSHYFSLWSHRWFQEGGNVIFGVFALPNYAMFKEMNHVTNHETSNTIRAIFRTYLHMYSPPTH